jgi:hypothetical protein
MENTKCWQGCEEMKSSHGLVGMSSSAVTLESNLDVNQKLSINFPYVLEISFLGVFPRDMRT